MRTHLLLGSALTLIALCIGFVLAGYFPTNLALGSVEFGSEYSFTHVTSSDVGSSSVKTLAGTIGSVVISSTTPTGTLSFYATSTTATSSADLLFTIDPNTDEGTYTYDVGFAPKLIIDVGAGFNGNYVITWR